MYVVSNTVGKDLKNQNDINALCKQLDKNKITKKDFDKKLNKLLTE